MDSTMWTMTLNGDDDDAIAEEGFKSELRHGIFYYWMEADATTSMESLPAAAVVVLVVVGRSRLWRTRSAEAQPQSVGGGSFGNKGKILEGNPICLRLFAVLVAITHLQSTK